MDVCYRHFTVHLRFSLHVANRFLACPSETPFFPHQTSFQQRHHAKIVLAAQLTL